MFLLLVCLLKKNSFSCRLKVLVWVSSCSDDGRLFQALGPAHEIDAVRTWDACAGVRNGDCWWSADEDAKWCRLMRLKTGNFETKTLKSVTSSNSEIVDVRLHFRSNGSEKPHRRRCTDRSIDRIRQVSPMCDVVTPTGACDQAGGSVLRRLQASK